MLPRLTANAGYLARDRDLVSSTRSARSGLLSENQTIGVDRQRFVADVTLPWSREDRGTGGPAP